ncbi:hypothetical protein LEP1GSC038_3626 [Leptospira weilii str. 2006001855]|uniref:Insertion element IS402-like domain-containing protein n=2 Tax=Leptospira weilii TaxID=28184 RepID=M6QG63_9LEPT|nr:hypothetical protein LEP1GSC038_3626 [Leptospira weilii str. 2006001855]EMN92270.1 hypothetical protein LEP1GSC108_4596 [Leptospira weilii str. UI 13098]
MAAIFYRVRTGVQWRYIPSMFGSKSKLHRRFQEWVEEYLIKLRRKP